MMPSIDPTLERGLRLRAEQLRREIATVRGPAGESAAGEVRDAKDAADTEVRSVVADAEVERDLAELRDIDLALEKIADGTYGICDDCGNRIDPRRTRAQPAARRCLACQSAAEAARTGTASGPAGAGA